MLLWTAADWRLQISQQVVCLLPRKLLDLQGPQQAPQRSSSATTGTALEQSTALKLYQSTNLEEQHSLTTLPHTHTPSLPPSTHTHTSTGALPERTKHRARASAVRLEARD